MMESRDLEKLKSEVTGKQDFINETVYNKLYNKFFGFSKQQAPGLSEEITDQFIDIFINMKRHVKKFQDLEPRSVEKYLKIKNNSNVKNDVSQIELMLASQKDQIDFVLLLKMTNFILDRETISHFLARCGFEDLNKLLLTAIKEKVTDENLKSLFINRKDLSGYTALEHELEMKKVIEEASRLEKIAKNLPEGATIKFTTDDPGPEPWKPWKPWKPIPDGSYKRMPDGSLKYIEDGSLEAMGQEDTSNM